GVAGTLASAAGRSADTAELLSRALPGRRAVPSDAIPIQLLRARALVELGRLDDAKRDIDAVDAALRAQYGTAYFQADLDITRAAWLCAGRRPDDLAQAEATPAATSARLRAAGLPRLATAPGR